MAWYNVDFKTLGTEILPVKLRKNKFTSYVAWLLEGVSFVYNAWKNKRTVTLIRAKTTSQVYSLEKFLNDKYDTTKRRIKVVDGNKYNATYLYLKRENNPVYIYKENENKPIYLYLESEIGDDTLSFIVQVPRDIYSNKEEIIKDVNLFKEASKTFITTQI